MRNRVLLLLLLCLPAPAVLVATGALARGEEPLTCAYDPTSGEPNPLGNRTFIVATERDGGVEFTYEQLPQPVGAERVTLGVTRTLIFHDTDMAAARSKLLASSRYYAELVGYEDSEGFGPYDAVMSCTAETR